MAWIVDIDGTLALRGERGPFDWRRVGEDEPNPPVLSVVRALIHDGHQIIYMSGRMEQCRALTRAWLNSHKIDAIHLYMRPDDDFRPDQVVKRELFEKHIRGVYEVEGIIDDRARVVRMWRDELGLTVLQCADGNF